MATSFNPDQRVTVTTSDTYTDAPGVVLQPKPGDGDKARVALDAGVVVLVDDADVTAA